MKKVIVLILVFVFMGSAAFGLNMAAGGGLLYNHSVTKGSITDDYILSGLDTFDWSMARNGFGAFAFFGLNYVEFNLGFLYKSPKNMEVTASSGGYSVSMTFDAKDYGLEGTGALQLGAYFKYPFPVSDVFVIFPTAGLDAEITISSDEGWWSDVWLRGGLGLDIFFNQRTFLRTHFIYGYGIPVGGEEILGLDYSHGLLVKVGVGFMF